MENFNELLQKYADFIVRVGVNPQPGQTLIINCPLEGAPLARLCVRSAYEAGARDVQVNWQDDAVTRIRMELGSEEALTDHKGWQLRRYLDYAESEGGVCVLHLIADDPELFAGLDGAKISRVNSANRSFMQPWREYTMNDRVQWSIAALPAAPWAKKMFPELDTAAAIETQWKLIFDTCRVTGGDPIGEWRCVRAAPHRGRPGVVRRAGWCQDQPGEQREPQLYAAVAGVHHERPGAVVHRRPACRAVGKEDVPGAGHCRRH